MYLQFLCQKLGAASVAYLKRHLGIDNQRLHGVSEPILKKTILTYSFFNLCVLPPYLALNNIKFELLFTSLCSDH